MADEADPNMTGDASLVALVVPADPPTSRVRTSEDHQDQLSDIPIHDTPTPVVKMSGAGYDVVVDVDEEVSY